MADRSDISSGQQTLTLQEAIDLGVQHHSAGDLPKAEGIYNQILEADPDQPVPLHLLGVIAHQTGNYEKAVELIEKALTFRPDYAEAHNNLGVVLNKLEKFEEATISYHKAIKYDPNYAEAHNNLGNALLGLGRLDESEASYKQAIALKPDYARAHNNLGNALQELGRVNESEASYKQAIALKPDLTDVYLNLSGCEKTINDAEHWIDKALKVDADHLPARLMKAALRFYQGDRIAFDSLMRSKFNQHAYMRSFSWVFSLPNLPELHFNMWYFFDAIVKKSIISKPFYEFGVWKGSSFKYLIKFFKKGYGFDTFTGLPEDWYLGSHIEKEGTYSSDGNVPKIKGGEFIVGKFEDTLPVFFSERRPTASVINFDADLYSSTICALNFSKQIIDKDTILVFDEFIMNESWEQDEFKALNEFCSVNGFSYEVVAISFLTKQVAVKLVGI